MAGPDQILLAAPSITDDEIAEVTAVLRSGWLTTGAKAAELERGVRDLVGAPAALAVSSGTAALQIAMKTLGVRAGDSVVMSTLGFVSAANAAVQLGAQVILLDVDPVTLNMDLNELAELVQVVAPKLIVPTHYAGLPVDMDRVLSIAAEHGCSVLDDAAHALGAEYDGTRIGGQRYPLVPHLTAFSFYATKNLSCGEGGMLTGPQELIDQARGLSLHGTGRPEQVVLRNQVGSTAGFEVVEPGYKANMPDVLAAIGVAQLRRFDAMQRRREELAMRYLDRLSSRALWLPARGGGAVRHAWHLFVVRLPVEMDRDQVARRLAEQGIGTSVHWRPIHQHWCHEMSTRPRGFFVADNAYRRMLSLPLHPEMADGDVDRVVDTLTEEMGR